MAKPRKAMDRKKIIHFPTPGTPRRQSAGHSLPPRDQVVELTLTIPKADAGPATFPRTASRTTASR